MTRRKTQKKREGKPKTKTGSERLHQNTIQRNENKHSKSIYIAEEWREKDSVTLKW